MGDLLVAAVQAGLGNQQKAVGYQMIAAADNQSDFAVS